MAAYQSVENIMNQAAGVPVTVTGSLANDGLVPIGNVASLPELFNGATWDKQRNNLESALVALGTRTSSFYSPTLTNHNAKGIMFFINVTAISGTTPGLTLTFNHINSVNGASIVFGGMPNITATGLYNFTIYPNSMITAAEGYLGNLIMPLSRQLSLSCNITGTTPSITFAIDYTLLT